MNWVNIVVTVLILVLMIGILISTHELGHLLVAKAFNVYCFEYSIGFGPRLFHFKRKGSETDISFRAFPLGGYVSMYSEDGEKPEGMDIPLSRSVEGISTWKRILVMLAGVMVNLFTAVLFAMIYATCIPNYVQAEAFDTGVNVMGQTALTENEATARAYSLRIRGSLGVFELDDESYRLYSPMRLSSLPPSDIDYPYLLDSSASLERDGETRQVVAAFSFSTVNGDNDFLSNISFFETDTNAFLTPTQEKLLVKALPKASNPVELKEGDKVSLNLYLLPVDAFDTSPTRDSFENLKMKTIALHTEAKEGDLSLKTDYQNDLRIAIYTKWLPFGTRLLNGCYYIANFFNMIGQAFVMIFTGNFGAVGSIVAAGAQISTLTAEIGVARTFFFYGGFLSLNLAIFNLLPFPGLDGYQILVAAVEKVFHKKIPPKVKAIISYVGLGILFLFSFFIIVRDILRLF
mgnify:CR=1 FL=1